MNAVLIAVLGGLGAMLGWGFADFFAKVSIDKIGELPSLVWAHAVGTAALGVVVVSQVMFSRGDFHMPNGKASWGGLALFGALQAIVYLLIYRGFGKGQVAVLSPVFASFSGLVALVSILILGEAATVVKLVSLALIFAGTLLLSTDKPTARVRFFKTPGFREVLLAAICATVWTLGWDRLVSGRDPITFAFFMYGFMTTALYGLARLQRVTLSRVPRDVWWVLMAIGVGEAIAYVSLTWGYSRTPLTSVVALMSGAFSLPTIILARTFLKERVSGLQTVGAVGVIGGVVALALR